jgi:PKD repeat protein
MKFLKYTIIFVFVVWVNACTEDNIPVPQASTLVPSFSYSSLNENFAPDTIQFTNTTETFGAAGEVTYTWNFGDGTLSHEADPIHIFKNPGTYDVKLVVVNDDQLSESTQSILVKDPNALFVRLFYIDDNQKVISEVNGASLATQGGGIGIEYDASTGDLYYSDVDNGAIWKVNLESGVEEKIIENLDEPQDIALDANEQLLWVADRGANAIIEVDLTNNSSKELFTAADGLGELPVAIDQFEDKLYITCVEIDFESVWVAKKDGSEITNIIDYAAGGYGYGIAIDKTNRKIYFDNRDNFEILSANLDGSDITKVTDTNGRIYGMVVDNANGKLYWSDFGDAAIKMANLDGSEVVNIALDLDSPRGLFFIDE